MNIIGCKVFRTATKQKPFLCKSIDRDRSHSISFDTTDTAVVGDPRKPYPYRSFEDAASNVSQFIRMPCSEYNIDIAGNSNWEKVKKAFDTRITSLPDFLSRVKQYNTKIRNIDGLISYSNSLPDKHSVINEILPNIVKIALLLPKVFGQPLPYLSKASNSSLSITRYQIACLIANGFLCSFPGRDNECFMDGQHLGNFNLSKLFEQTSPTAILKIKCIVSYLEQSIFLLPEGIITLSRFSNDTPVNDWINESIPISYSQECELQKSKQTRRLGLPILTDVGFDSKIGIQNTRRGIGIVDFANKLVGGGFIGNGIVQEEILFTCYPELLVAKLITDKLEDSEVLCVTGAHKYFEIENFGTEIRFVKHTMINEEWDDDRHLQTQIIMMDAIPYNLDVSRQYLPPSYNRELGKAFSGFTSPIDPRTFMTKYDDTAIATGNWGCGVFKGDNVLKFLIQLIAISASNKTGMLYHTFGDNNLQNDLFQIHAAIVRNNQTTSDVYKLLETFCSTAKQGKERFSSNDWRTFFDNEFSV